MKKASTKSEVDMQAEYGFASMKEGVRGKYSKLYRAETDGTVNRALPAVVRPAA